MDVRCSSTSFNTCFQRDGISTGGHCFQRALFISTFKLVSSSSFHVFLCLSSSLGNVIYLQTRLAIAMTCWWTFQFKKEEEEQDKGSKWQARGSKIHNFCTEASSVREAKSCCSSSFHPMTKLRCQMKGEEIIRHWTCMPLSLLSASKEDPEAKQRKKKRMKVVRVREKMKEEPAPESLAQFFLASQEWKEKENCVKRAPRSRALQCSAPGIQAFTLQLSISARVDSARRVLSIFLQLLQLSAVAIATLPHSSKAEAGH